jgi:hypothetical protein
MGRTEEYFREFNALEDIACNNYIGSPSLYKNLELIRRPVLVKDITNSKYSVMYGIEPIMGKIFVDKIWEIIMTRFNKVNELGKLIVR